MLRAAALIALLAGAVGSIGFMLVAGHRNPSRLLLLLFAIWVLSPFVGLGTIGTISNRWPAIIRAALYSVMLVVALGSAAIYGAIALGPPRPQAAFVFVVVPPASWLLMAIVLLTAAFITNRLSRRSDAA